MKGFSLIELLVVFAIIGLVTMVAIPGFLNFNKGQALKSAGSELKANLRYAQNASLSGKKETCLTTDILEGFFLTFIKSGSSYSMGVRCGAKNFIVKIYQLPLGVTINRFYSDTATDDPSQVTILFQPVNKGVAFKDGNQSGPVETFSWGTESLKIVLRNDANSSYSVTVKKGGDIYENKE